MDACGKGCRNDQKGPKPRNKYERAGEGSGEQHNDHKVQDHEDKEEQCDAPVLLPFYVDEGQGHGDNEGGKGQGARVTRSVSP